MIRAACTIVSLNYLPQARTICESYLSFHPNDRFYVLLVDRLPENFDLEAEKFEIVLVEDLRIPNFTAISFQYGILELNTNVKPTFLRVLFEQGAEQVLYFDPDIIVYSALNLIFREIDNASIVLTPHALSPNDENTYSEVLLLRSGVFNLGFLALSRCSETDKFLQWWEARCLALGFDERWSGLFVDQKWVNLVPCYFQSVTIFKHPGCNVAYWNLHERILSQESGKWMVNYATPLLFFHFSGMSMDGGDQISKHTEQFDLLSRPDIRDLFLDYRSRLVKNGMKEFEKHRYAFGYFTNGAFVNKLQRAAFAANIEKFSATDPFDSSGPFYLWAQQRRLESREDSVSNYSRKAYSSSDTRVRAIHFVLRLVLRFAGADRYTVLMKYLEYCSVLRNQKDILG